MIDDSLVTNSRDLLNPSTNTYSTDFGNSVESPDLITPQSAVNNLPVVGTSQETINIEAQAVNFNNSLIPVDTLLFPQSAEVLTLETVSSPTLPEASPTDLLTGQTPLESGVFTVGDTGDIGIDFLFDGGNYQGELAIFSLDGMDEFKLGSETFIQEAARRALSDSQLGHVVISDSVERAHFSDSPSIEGNLNTEQYLGVKTFSMNPRDEFGVMLVPNGTVEQVFDNPAIGGAVRPLFSIATANPDDAFQAGQIADVTGEGNTFVFEDLRVDMGSDRDYNDIIFQVRGATGQATQLDKVIDPSQEWRNTNMGQALSAYAQPYITPDIGEVTPENPAVIPTTPVDPIQFEFPESDQPLVGIIDTGFSTNNPDIDYSRIILGQDRVDGDANPLLQPDEGNEHGTHILGIIAATQDNNIGIDGVNDNAPLWVGRAVGSGQWAESLVEFVDTAKASGQPNAVVNLSFDLTQVNPDGSVTTRYEFTAQEWAALEYAHQNGVIVVAAAGNESSEMSALGQASQVFDNIITVGASENFDPFVSLAQGVDRTSYSSYGTGLDILADGGTPDNPALSTVGDDLGTMAGTSVAAARVTGTLSQVWAANPQLSYSQVIEILKSTATDLNVPNADAETGAGLLNPVAAVYLAQATTPLESEPFPVTNIPETWSEPSTASERPTATLFRGEYYDWTSYTVQSGDTLSKIAQNTMGNGSAPYYSFIAEHNGIANPHLLEVGQQILVPTQASAPSEFMGKYYKWVPYTIVSGDTLSAIAQNTMGNDSAPYYSFIAEHNSIANPDLIFPGQQILVPEEVSTPTNPNPQPIPTPEPLPNPGGSSPGDILTLPKDEQRQSLGVNPQSSNYQSSGNKFAAANGTGQTYLWCTDYAFGRALEKGLIQGNSGIGGAIRGNAGAWDNNVISAGYADRVQSQPRANSFIVWEAYTAGAGSVGHVGFVEAVYSDGSFLVSESNWGNPRMSFHLRHVRPGTSAYTNAKFIYLG
jgi:nucleoid-associated protein YgaU/surface antigen